MGHTYTKAHFHIVFSTKSRQKLITPSVQPRLWAYMAGICSNWGPRRAPVLRTLG